jgi:hypothetical protein
LSNMAGLPNSTVGGGIYNTASSDDTTVAGGQHNTASGPSSAVGGGAKNSAGGFATTVGGGYSNMVSGGYSFIGGGYNNNAGSLYGAIGGGYSNTVSGDYSFIGGGQLNIAGSTASAGGNTIGGGYSNTVRGTFNSYNTIGGGSGNTISGNMMGYNTIGGGTNNNASGQSSTIPGGEFNTASGDLSFAAGSHANTNNQLGAFVWGDASTSTNINATAPNQFIVRSAGGVGINTNSTVANALTVQGQVFAGSPWTSTPIEPFVSAGSASGLSLDDRAGLGNPRWVIYPNSGALRFFNDGFGDVVTITSNGKLTANGGFNGQCLQVSGNPFDLNTGWSCNMDVAEAFVSAERTAPGDLVALEPQTGAAPTVRKASHAYDNLLIGIVSQNPGLVFDNGQTHLAGDNSTLITEDKTVVALVGRVLANVSMENGPIAVGDPLTSASTPGAAMKAAHAGKIIGYALADVTRDGQALVLLQPGLYLPASDLATQAENTQLKERVVALDAQQATTEARLAALEQRTSAVSPAWLIGGGGVLVGLLLARRRNP